MNRVITPRSVALLFIVLSLVLRVEGFQSANVVDEARRAVSAVDDNASSLEDRQKALHQLREATRLFLAAGEKVEAARVLNRMGRLQLALNDPIAASESHNRALDLLKHHPEPQTEVDNLNSLAEVYLRSDRLEEVEPLLRRARELSEQVGYKAGGAQALLNLSDLQNYQDHSQSLQTARQSLEEWQSLDNKSGMANAYAQIGQCYLAQHKLPESIESYLTALRIWRDSDNKLGQARALIALGMIEIRKGNWSESISLHTQAQALIDPEAEPRRMGQVAVGLAESFNNSGLPEIGLTHFQRALEYYRQTKDPDFIGYGYWGLGITYYLLKDYTKANIHFNEALTQISANSVLAAQSHEYLGRVAIATHDYELARQHLSKALATYNRTGNIKEAGQAYGLLGEIYSAQGQPRQAQQFYDRALTIFTSLSDKLNQAAIFYVMGRLALKQNNYDAAEKYLKQSIDVTENIRRISTSSDLTTAFSATVHDRYRTYIECLMRKHFKAPGQRIDEQAFAISELARGRSLAELLRSTQTILAHGIDPQLAQREKNLRQSLRVNEDTKIGLLAHHADAKQLQAIEEQTLRLEAEYEQVINTIKAFHPSYAEIQKPTGLNLAQVQQQILNDDQTVLLEYSLGEDNSYVWAITRSGFSSHKLPSEAAITSAAKDVYDLLASIPKPENASTLTAAINKLSAMVLSPVAGELTGKRVIVVADGALHYIPFQILRTQPGTSEPLVASSQVVNAPSASILNQLRQETQHRKAPERVLAAFGDPVFASNYGQYKDAARTEQMASMRISDQAAGQQFSREIDPEADEFNPATIRGLFYSKIELANLREVAGNQSFVGVRFDATREKLASFDLTKYSILHLATHGKFDPKRPEKSGLFLSMVNMEGNATNGFLGLEDIYHLHAPVDLVVLSACRTGLGKSVSGEGLIGLTRGFMYAGASSVVASLWKVDDEATAALMKHFYINMLQQHMAPAEALRAAQNSIRQQPQWNSPYFWAAFTLQGEYNKSVRTPAGRQSSNSSTFIFLGILAGILSIAGWWLFRSRKGENRTT